jgi:hypothetical protein
MRRRHFLLGLVVAPLFIRRAFGDTTLPDKESTEPLDYETERTRKRSRRLLIIVVPSGDTYARGRLWGEYFSFGSDRELSPLTGVEVIAARVPEELGSPLFVVVDTDGHATPYTLKEALPEFPLERDPVKARKSEKTIGDKRLAVLGAMLAEALGVAPNGGAQSVRERFVPMKKAPPGSVWYANDCPTCGMGYIPERTRQMLMFYTKDTHRHT